jgi:immunomodulating metalloprotease
MTTLRQALRVSSLLAAAAMASLAGCGGGSGNGNSGNTGPDGGNGSGTGNAADVRLAAALASGDPTGLASTDTATLLERAIAEATSCRQAESTVLSAVYGDGKSSPDLSLNIGTNSASITPLSSTTAVALIQSDNGNGLAAVTVDGKGRGLAYGADVLQWMSASAREQQHYPQFLSSFKWVLTGSGSGTLPSSLKFATAGYNASTVKNFLTRAGTTGEAVDCAVADPANTCWNTVDLVVMGGSVTASSGLTALIRSYLAAGKAVIYMHPNWGQSAGGSQVLAGLGMKLGEYPGNYFAAAAGVSVSASRTVADVLNAKTTLSELPAALKLLQASSLSLDLQADTSALAPFSAMLAELGHLQSSGVALFNDDSRFLLHRLLVLWADQQRPTLVYGKLSRSDAVNFVRTYATDAFVWFARSTTKAATAGQGDYMPASAQTLSPSTTAEELRITLPQASGTTLIGRGALPARGVQVEVVEAAGATLGLQTSLLRSWGNPLNDDEDTYARPLRPHSFNIPLSTTGPTAFVSPNGGPLMLSYSGATPNTVVTLRIKGVTRYAHFDYANPMSDADVADAVAALNAGTYGWQTTKVVGGEVQQIMAYAKSIIGSLSPSVYANTHIRDGLFMSNHLTNGYNDAGMSAKVTSLCASFGWTCTGSLHDTPAVQHFVGWIATCGYLCSGDPIDGYAGIGLGWGYAHELGHNTVQRVMRMVPEGTTGCSTECDNNLLASATALRAYALWGMEISSDHPLDHAGLYAALKANRATGLSGDALLADQTTRIWNNSHQDIMRSVHFQLAFLFSKYRSGVAQPTLDSTLDYFSLLTKGDRLVSEAFSAATASSYGMGRYTTNSITNHDLLYVLSSKIIGQDLRKVFWMYGLPLSDTALGSVADLSLPMAPRAFYALPAGQHNQLATGQWLDVETSVPAWPY